MYQSNWRNSKWARCRDELLEGVGVLYTFNIIFFKKKNRICFRDFSFCVEQRPLRTQSVSMWSSLQNSGRKSMRKKKRKTRRCVTPYSGWRMNSTDGGMVRSSFLCCADFRQGDAELLFRVPKIMKNTMSNSTKNTSAKMLGWCWSLLFFIGIGTTLVITYWQKCVQVCWC